MGMSPAHDRGLSSVCEATGVVSANSMETCVAGKALPMSAIGYSDRGVSHEVGYASRLQDWKRGDIGRGARRGELHGCHGKSRGNVRVSRRVSFEGAERVTPGCLRDPGRRGTPGFDDP